MSTQLKQNRWVRAEVNLFRPSWRKFLESGEKRMRKYFTKKQRRNKYSDEVVQMLWRKRNLRQVSHLRELREKFNRIELDLDNLSDP